MNEFLKVSNISKSFAGVNALNNVSLTIYSGEVSCLVGENGSGKSTLIKTIAGVHQPDTGEITIAGRRFTSLRPMTAIQQGIQVIYQDFSLFPNLTVAENIALNQQVAQKKRFVNWREVRSIAQAALAQTEIDLPLNREVGDLSVADKQLIAISRAILQNARLIIMDEPTTALTEKEVEVLFRVIRNLQKNNEMAVLFVSHKLNEVKEIAERVIVLRNGEKVLDTEATDLDQRNIAYYMTGHDIAQQPYAYEASQHSTQPLLQVDNLTLTGGFENVSFTLRPGEILGITGLLGSGRTELALSLFGVRPATSGAIQVDGQRIRINSIQDALHHQIGYVPEDRLTEGLFLPRSIGNNIVVRVLKQLMGTGGLLDNQAISHQIGKWVDDLSIKTSNPQLPVQSLSGGNQQRVVIAKWLASNPRVLILNGPTVGVDIGSKAEIHDIIKGLAQAGMGIIVISDDIPEVMETCNRILLMRRGRIVDELQTSDITEQQLSARLRETAVLMQG
ncbi:MAG: sugar ABC transporter ATP-binding protein [Anaerolineae bacterium]